jgi:type I restriction enzyme, S subunit
MKQGWEVKKLNQISDNLDSQRVPITKNIRSKGTIPYYGASGIVDYVAEYLFDEDLLCISEDGANLLARTYPIAFSITGKTWVNNHAHVLRFNNMVSQKFVELYLNSIKLDDFVSGMAQPKLNQTMLNKIPIPLPLPPEQKRIVAILDKAFAAIAKTKANADQNLKNAKELFESYLQGVFENKGEGWEEKPLKEVCELKSGTTISPSLERNSGDVLYTKVADMNLPENLVEINTSSRFVNSDEIKQKQVIPKGAIIFPKRGGAIATNKKRKIIKPTIVDLNTMAIIPGKKIGKDYFYHWFQLFDLNDISNGANIPQINNYSFDEIYVPYPVSLKEQQTIVKKLDALSTEAKKLEAIYQRKITDLEELKKSILQKAFSGELTEKDIAL